MMPDIKTARDEILTLLTEAWDAAPEAEDLEMQFWNLASEPPSIPDDDGNPPTWVRVILKHLGGGQSTLAGADATARSTFTGILTVEIYEARSSGGEQSDILAKIFIDALTRKATPGAAWFRNVRPVDYGEDGLWFRVDVMANFEYDIIVN